MTDTLRPDAITTGLGTLRIGREVRCLGTIPSTNDAAFEWIESAEGAPEGGVVVADAQTKGRGRHGRSWVSPAGAGVWCSVVLRPAIPRDEYAFVTAIGALAAADAVRRQGVAAPRIRWPNDLLVGGRKIAGVLAEVRDGPKTAGAAVLGIGLNLHFEPGALPPDVAATATWLSRECGFAVERAAVLRDLLRALDGWYETLAAGDRGEIEETWRRLSALPGQRVRVRDPSGTVEGRVVEATVRDVTLDVDGGGRRTLRGERILGLEVLPASPVAPPRAGR